MGKKPSGSVLPIGYDITDAQKALKELDKETKGSFKELQAIDKVLKFNPDNTELLTQKMGALGETIDGTKKRLDILKTAQEEASKNTDTEKGQEEYRKLKREVIETESKLELYQSRLNKVTDEMNGHVKKLDAFGDGLKNAGDKMKSAGDKMEKVGTGATKFVTGPILGIGAAAMVAWTEVDEATDGIMAATGATGEEAVALEESFKSVAKSVPNSLGDTGSALATLNQKLDLSGEALEDATKAALQYADVNKVDVNSSVESVTKVMAAADIESKDFSKTLGKLTVVSQESGVSVDDLTAAYEKSGPALRNLGYSFDESIAMIGQWEKAGLNSEDMLKGMQKYIVSNDKATEALAKTHDKETKTLENLEDKLRVLKETKGKTTEETEKLKKKEVELTKKIEAQRSVVEESGKALESTTAASREEMDKLVQSIKNSKDPQEKMNKAIEVFGTKNGPAFVEAIESGKLEYEDFAKVVADSNGKLAETWEATQDPIDKFNEKMNNIKIIGAELGGELQEAAIPLIEEFGKAIEGLAEWFSKLTEEEKENIIKYGAIIAAVGPVLVIMGKLTTAVGNVATAAGGAVKKVSGMFAADGIFGTGGKLAGMAGPIGLATIAVGLLAVAIYEAGEDQRKYKAIIEDSIGGIDEFSEAIERANPLIKDFDEYATRYDKGIAEKKEQIKTLEPQITTILADNVAERSRLTDEEMAKLQEYLGLLDTLNQEIAKKYGVRLKVLEQQLNAETELNDTKAAEYIKTVNEADSKLSANANENHVNKMVQLEAMLENENNLRKSGKTAEADIERANYESLKAEADAQRDSELAQINMTTVEKLQLIKDKFVQVNEAETANLKTIGGIRDEEARIESKYNEEMDKLKADKNISYGLYKIEENRITDERTEALKASTAKEIGLWDESTQKVGSALMQQVANIILHGGEIDAETATMVDSFIKTMGGSEESAESFKKAMEESIAGIVASEPELAGEASDLVKNFNTTIDDVKNGKYELGGSTVGTLSNGITDAKKRATDAADSIRKTVRDNITPSQGSTVFLGKQLPSGVAKGIYTDGYLAENAARWLAGRTESAFKKKLEINSPSRVFDKWARFIPEGAAGGVRKNAWMLEEAMEDLAKIPAEVDWMTDPSIAQDFSRASLPSEMLSRQIEEKRSIDININVGGSPELMNDPVFVEKLKSIILNEVTTGNRAIPNRTSLIPI